MPLLFSSHWSPPRRRRAQAGELLSISRPSAPYQDAGLRHPRAERDFGHVTSVGSSRRPAPTRTRLRGGTGSGNAGDTYSFGAAGSATHSAECRAAPWFPSSALCSRTTRVRRSPASRSPTWASNGELGRRHVWIVYDSRSSLNATSLNTGTWVDVDALDFVAPTTTGAVGALDGEAAANRTSVSRRRHGVSSVPSGGTFRIRWTDFNATGADDGLAIDDFTVTPHGGGATTAFNRRPVGHGGRQRRDDRHLHRDRVDAAHGGVTFDIATADGTGPPAATAADGDYVRPHSVCRPAAGTDQYTFDVTVNGDRPSSPTKPSSRRLSDVSGARWCSTARPSARSPTTTTPPVATDVVISQVYGGGGNAGATLTHDFVELFNRGTHASTHAVVGAVHVGGRYGHVGGDAARRQHRARRLLPGSAGAGRRRHDAAAGAGRHRHDRRWPPAPGKVALQVTTTAPIVGACPAGSTADLVGYGARDLLRRDADRPRRPATRRRRCASAAAASTPTTTTSTSRSAARAAQHRHRRRGAAPVAGRDSRHPGQRPVSPFAGQDVITTGIVTGVKSNGFFLQTPDDGTPIRRRRKASSCSRRRARRGGRRRGDGARDGRASSST